MGHKSRAWLGTPRAYATSGEAIAVFAKPVGCICVWNG